MTTQSTAPASQAAPRETGYRVLLEYPRFFWLWSGQTISAFGDGLYMIGLPWLAYELSGSAFVLGVTRSATALPPLLLALYAGVVVDRTNKRSLMIASDLIRALLLLSVPLALWLKLANPWVVVAIALLEPSVGAFYKPARAAVMQELVPPDELMPANSLVSISSQIASIIAPALAGILIAWLGQSSLFTFDSLTFVASAACLLAVGRLQHQPTVRKPAAVAAVKEAFVFLRSRREIMASFLLQAVDAGIAMGPIFVGIPILVKEVLGLGVDVFGYVMSAFFVGMLASSAVMTHIGNRLPKGRVIVWGYLGLGLSFVGFVFAYNPWTAIGSAALHGLFIPAVVIPIPSLIQQVTPPELIGRIFSLYSAIGTGLTALSALLTGLLAAVVPIHLIFAVAAAAFILCTCIGRAIPELWHAR